MRAAWKPVRHTSMNKPFANSQFQNLYAHDFARVAVATPRCRVADPVFNAGETIELARQAASNGAVLVAFPELGLSAYTCDDLFHQRALLDACEAALQTVIDASAALDIVMIVGMPVRCRTPAVQLRGGGGERPPARGGAEDLSAELRRILRRPPVQRRRLRRRHGSDPVRPERALRRRPAVRTGGAAPVPLSRGDLRRRVGADPAVLLRRAGRRHRAGQSVGLQRPGRQGRLPPAAGGPAIGALHRRLPVHLGRHRRIDHRHGLGRPVADLRERRIADQDRPLHRTVAPGLRRHRPGAPVARAHAPGDLRPLRPTPCRRGQPVRGGAHRRDGADGDRAAPEPPRRAFSLCAVGPGAARRALHRGGEHPGAGAGAKTGVEQNSKSGDRRVGRARFDPCAADLRARHGPARSAAHQYPRLHHARLRHQRSHHRPGAEN